MNKYDWKPDYRLNTMNIKATSDQKLDNTRIIRWRNESSVLNGESAMRKMSQLEFVAIQFDVKFTVFTNLRQYVDRVCQHYFILS